MQLKTTISLTGCVVTPPGGDGGMVDAYGRPGKLPGETADAE